MDKSTIILPSAETIWKPIPDFEGYYEVSNTGLVRGVTRSILTKTHLLNISSLLLRPKFDKDCYLNVVLSKHSIRYNFRVHRLVAENFIDNPHNLPIPDHINQVRWDNRVDNLRWITQSENVFKAYSNGRNQGAERPVMQIDLNGVTIKKYPSIRSVERDGFSAKNVNQVVLGQKKTHLGYKWEYDVEAEREKAKWATE